MLAMRFGFSFVLAVCLTAAAVQAADKVDLKVGDAAPKFECTDDAGKTFKAADHLGKKAMVVYFYPIATTGGCTKQACGFRDAMAKLKDKDVVVVGVSGDSPVGLKLFRELHNLNFTLLSDSKGEVANAFGVPTNKGRKFKGKDKDGKEVEWEVGVVASRWTFVIGKDGKIAAKETKVNAAEDAKKVTEIIENLK
jgi:thioredoxin-dependent peroxiredoxin